MLDSLPSCLLQVLTSQSITPVTLSAAAMQELAWRLLAMASAWKEHALVVLWMDRLLVCSLAKSTTAARSPQKVPMVLLEDFERLMV